MTKILVDEIQAPGGKPFKVSKDGGVLGEAGGAGIVEVTTLPDSSTSGSVGDQVLYKSNIYRYLAENAYGHLWKGITTNYTSQITPIGEEIFHVSGTFTVPARVENISVVAVGAGGGGSTTWADSGGTGGALAWASDVPVTPGQTIAITISLGQASYSGRTDKMTNGDDSIVGGILIAEGGGYGNTWSEADYTILTSAALSSGGGKGGGRSGSWNGGGGGAGGYTGDGGDGIYGNGMDGAGGGGGGGGGYPSSTYAFGGGGGVGIFGTGPNPGGAGGTYTTHGNTWDSISNNYSAGKGGSGGKDGIGQTNSGHSGRDISWPDGNNYGELTQYHGWGGMYGGGAGGAGTSMTNNSLFGKGGSGVVRIIWGEGRSFPDNAGYVIPVT